MKCYSMTQELRTELSAKHQLEILRVLDRTQVALPQSNSNAEILRAMLLVATIRGRLCL